MAGDRASLSPDEGAETPVSLALLPPGSPSGEFWKEKKIAVW
jgi:carbonyl reductase 1